MGYAGRMRRAALLLLAFAAFPALAAVIEGRVIEVTDGRTITVLASGGSSMHRVRIAGLETPPRSSPYANHARESLRRLVGGKAVRVDTFSLDTSGRLVGIVLVLKSDKECGGQPCEERVDPALTQIAAGMATIDKTNVAYQSEEVQRRYALALEHARKYRLGQWRDGAFQMRPEALSRAQ